MKAVYAFAAVALLLVAPAASARQLKQASSGITDADILNFALNLECLEAQFYTCATTGAPLSAELTGNGPEPIGCQMANFTNDDVMSIAMNIAADERAHVNFLRTALGNSSVQCPLVDIGPAFAAAANAATNMTLNPPFTPYANDLFFLHGAFIFEDLGVTAYKGAAPLIQSSDILSAAAGILAVEAYHSGAIRTLLIQNGDVVTPYGVNVTTIVNAISAARMTLDGSMTTDDVGIYDPMTIAYLSGSDMTVGGFFPDGVNGNIQ